jgi:NHL repeat
VILTVKTPAVSFGIAGVALDGQGNLYLTEMDDDLIYKYSTSGSLVAQWGGTGPGPGQLTSPEKLAFDPQGNLYVTEFGSPSFDGSMGGNDRVQKFSRTGVPLAQWGTLGSGPGQFNGPVGIAVDPQGNIYVAEREITESRNSLLPANRSRNGTPLVAVSGSAPRPVSTSPSMPAGTFTSQSRILMVPATSASRSFRRLESDSHIGERLVRAPGNSINPSAWRWIAKAMSSWWIRATIAYRSSRPPVSSWLSGKGLKRASSAPARWRWTIAGTSTCLSGAKS